VIEEFRSVTTLVTGGAGYIGSHMVRALADAGERVVVLDNLTTGFDWSLAPDVLLVVGDTGDQARVAALLAEHRVDAIIHFAASLCFDPLVRGWAWNVRRQVLCPSWSCPRLTGHRAIVIELA
jgi:nucleoside-diphosphate-sugar epimerase